MTLRLTLAGIATFTIHQSLLLIPGASRRHTQRHLLIPSRYTWMMELFGLSIREILRIRICWPSTGDMVEFTDPTVVWFQPTSATSSRTQLSRQLEFARRKMKREIGCCENTTGEQL